jgi:UDP-N-acetylmuramate--alanine ligase
MTYSAPDFDSYNLRESSRIFFVGIGGISMSGLAELALNSGCQVAGSDRTISDRTDYLAGLGIPVYAGHRADWIDQFKPDLVVHTAAVHSDNPELIRAKELAIRTIDRATFLGWLNREYSQVINIAGTHGKTTTTAMTSLILMEANVDPTVHLGAELIQFNSTVRVGAPGQVMVSEACEYMNSFLKFYSTIAAVLNIDYDHVDCFLNIDAVIDTFAEFADHLPEHGTLVIPSFDRKVSTMVEKLQTRRQSSSLPMPRLIWFGAEDDLIDGSKPEYYFRSLNFSKGLPSFDVWHNDEFYCHLHLLIPGRHNVDNALAAIACAACCGGTPTAAASALNSFQGAEGRFTYTGDYRGAQVIADYAHHPSAARATLAAASHMPHAHTWVVFQPLTFSRTKALLDDFAQALRNCERVILAEIFSDREINLGDISSSMLADRINELGGNAEFIPDFQHIQARLDQLVNPGDLILVLGPEDIRSLADHLTGRKTGHK